MNDFDTIPELACELDANYIRSQAQKYVDDKKVFVDKMQQFFEEVQKNPKVKPLATPPPSPAVFLSYFRYLSLTSQREFCRANGWFYAPQIAWCPTDDDTAAGLSHLWRTITSKTKLIVIGQGYQWARIAHLLNRNVPQRVKKGLPPFSADVPIVMESEIHKFHPDYPSLTQISSWDFQLPKNSKDC